MDNTMADEIALIVVTRYICIEIFAVTDKRQWLTLHPHSTQEGPNAYIRNSVFFSFHGSRSLTMVPLLTSQHYTQRLTKYQ